MSGFLRTAAVHFLLILTACSGIEMDLTLPDIKSLPDLEVLTKKNPDWQSPLLQQHHLTGRIWHPEGGRFVDEEELSEVLLRSAYILLGEKHDNPDHHILQARLVKNLTDNGRRPSVVWEMIPEFKQDVLDRFRAEYSDDAEALGAALSWDTSGWPDWRLYQPIAEAAMAEQLPMYAAGLPRSAVRTIAKGRPSFEFAKRRRMLGLHRPMAAELRARSIEQLYKGHCELMPRNALVSLFNVQRARDAVLSEHMLTGGGRDGSLLIAGNGHVREDIGVPLFLRRHQPGVLVTTVAFVEVQDEVLDPTEYNEQFSAPVLPFDYVWFTPRADDVDHCAELRKKWGKTASAKPAPAAPKEKPAEQPAPIPKETAKIPKEPIEVEKAPTQPEPDGKSADLEETEFEDPMHEEARQATDQPRSIMSNRKEDGADDPSLPPIPRSKPPRP